MPGRITSFRRRVTIAAAAVVVATGGVVGFGELSAASAPTSVTLTPIATGFPSPIGIDYYEPLNQLVLSVNYSGGQPNNFDTVDSGGVFTPFSNVSGLTDEVYISTIRTSACEGGFTVGDAFVGTGVPGQIARITNNGTTFIPNWVQLPGEPGLLRGGLFQDRYCAFGGDLIVTTDAGDVWRVTSAGVPTLVAAGVGDTLEGPTTVPNDPRYGPWAGTVVVSSEGCGCVESVTPAGGVTVWPGYPSAEGVHIVPLNENFFGVDFANSTLQGADAAQFSNVVGDVVVATESPGALLDVRWDPTANAGAGGFNSYDLLTTDAGQWEGTTFAPAGLPGVPPPSTTSTSTTTTTFVTTTTTSTTTTSTTSTTTTTLPRTTTTICKPGYGYGDTNHCHSGPPGR